VSHERVEQGCLASSNSSNDCDNLARGNMEFGYGELESRGTMVAIKLEGGFLDVDAAGILVMCFLIKLLPLQQEFLDTSNGRSSLCMESFVWDAHPAQMKCS
jgi:hypothetical protein